MAKRDTKVGDLCKELGVTREPLYRFVDPSGKGADKEANWLPAPKGAFLPMLRMYYPAEISPSILNGSWKLPPIVKVG
jgi:hypothetical protein